MKRVAILFATLFILSLLVTVAAVSQTTIYVNNDGGNDSNDGLAPGTAKATIQAGVNAAGTGGIVIVATGSGPYIESVNVSLADLMIQGDSGTPPTVAPSSGSAFTIATGITGVTIMNFEIVAVDGSGVDAQFSGNNDLTVSNTEIYNSINGIYVEVATNLTLSNNNIHDNTFTGMYLINVSSSSISNNEVTGNGSSGGSGGVYLVGNSNDVSNNTVSEQLNGHDGLTVIGSGNMLSENTANDNPNYGIYLADGNTYTLSGNTTNGNEYGIVLSNVSTVELVVHTSNDNTTAGIVVTNSSYNNDLKGLTLQNNSTGAVVTSGSYDNVLRNSSISGNTVYGVLLDNNANQNAIWNNSITNNGTDAGGSTAGIYVNGAGFNSISANVISGNEDWGVYFNSNEDNVLAMNNITGNDPSGAEGGGVFFDGPGWLNAQHNYWGGSGPTGDALGGPSSIYIVTMYYRTTGFTLPVSGDGPVYNSSQGKVYSRIGLAIDNANTGETVEVKTSGTVDNGFDIDYSGIQLLGAGMNNSYFYNPYGSIWIGSSSTGVVVSGLDIDKGAFIDPGTAAFEDFNNEGWSEEDAIEVYSNNVTMSNNRIRGGARGIALYPSSANNNTISGNVILWNDEQGIYIEGGYENTISDNIVYQNGYLTGFSSSEIPGGIVLFASSTNMLTGNTIANNAGTGLLITHNNPFGSLSYGNEINGNTIGSGTLSPGVLLPVPIDWTDSDIGGIFSIKAPTTGNDGTAVGVRSKRISEKRARLAKFMPQRKLPERAKQDGAKKRAQSGTDWKRQQIEERKAYAAEWKRLAPAYYAEAKEIHDEQKQAREALRAQRRANPTAYAAPSLKNAGVPVTIPTVGVQTSVTGNSIHGLSLSSPLSSPPFVVPIFENSVTENTIKGNGLAYGRDQGDGYWYPEPAGVALNNASDNYFGKNTIGDNYVFGIMVWNSSSINTIWNNTISGNGFATDGAGGGEEDKGAGVYFGPDGWNGIGGGHHNSISTNTISNNKGWGVRINSNDYYDAYDNAFVYNNFTGNAIGGLKLDNVDTDDLIVVNAQYNYWGSGQGVAVETDNTYAIISTLYAQTSQLPLPVSAIAPVIADGTIGFSSFQDAGFGGVSRIVGGETPIQQTPVGVQQKRSSEISYSTLAIAEYTGLVEEFGVELWGNGLIFSGAGKDGGGKYKSYLFLPNQNSVRVVDNDITIKDLDLDGGGMMDAETGVWGPNSSTSSTSAVIDIDWRSRTTILNNQIRGSDYVGVYAYNASTTLISANDVFWNRQRGLYFYGYDNYESVVQGNWVYENGSAEGGGGYIGGIVLENTNSVILAQNEIFNNALTGIFLRGNMFTTVDGNKVYNNGAFAYFSGNFPPHSLPGGIVLPGYNTYTIIQHNIVSNNVRNGVRIGSTGGNTFTLIQNNTIGETNASFAVKPLDLNAMNIMAKQRGVSLTGQVDLKNTGLDNERDKKGAGKTSGRRSLKVQPEGSPEITGKAPKMEQYAKRYAKLAKQRRAETKLNKEKNLREHRAEYKALKQARLAEKKAGKAQGRKFSPSSAAKSSAAMLKKVSGQAAFVQGNWETGGFVAWDSFLTFFLGNDVKGNGWGATDTESAPPPYTPAQAPGGLRIEDAFATLVLGNIFDHNSSTGILANSSSFSLVNLNIITGHTEFGVHNDNVSSTDLMIDARSNYWGAENGPAGGVNDPLTNRAASGSGNAVSANVAFDPFGPIPPSALGAFQFMPFQENVSESFGGVTFNFTNTGYGGFLAAGQFDVMPGVGEINDPDGQSGLEHVNRFWEILDIGGQIEMPMMEFSGNLVFNFTGLPDENYRVAYRQNFAGQGAPWTVVPMSRTQVNTANKTVTVTGITEFSQWTLLKPQSAPTISLIAPSTGSRGASMTVSVNGTNFVPGGTTFNFGGDIQVVSANVFSSTTAQLNISISQTATLGARLVTASTTLGGTSAPGVFTVNNPAPAITGVTPNSVMRGQSVVISISGSGFLPGLGGTKIELGPDISVGVPSLNGGKLEVGIAVSPTAAVGPRSVTVSNAAPGGGSSTLSGAINITAPTTGIELLSNIPTEFNLLQNFPNPFNPTTTIRFSLPEASHVKMVLYNTLGMEVQLFVDQELSPGVYQYRVKAEDLPSGMYIYTIRAVPSGSSESKPYISSKKLVLIK